MCHCHVEPQRPGSCSRDHTLPSQPPWELEVQRWDSALNPSAQKPPRYGWLALVPAASACPGTGLHGSPHCHALTQHQDCGGFWNSPNRGLGSTCSQLHPGVWQSPDHSTTHRSCDRSRHCMEKSPLRSRASITTLKRAAVPSVQVRTRLLKATCCKGGFRSPRKGPLGQPPPESPTTQPTLHPQVNGPRTMQPNPG